MSDSRELLEMRFKKYLHYASELPYYLPGDRFYQRCYTKESVPSLLKLLNEDNPISVIDTIVKVKKEETSIWPDSITFALAVCANDNAHRDVQNAAYKAVRTVCKTARDLVLFIKFNKDLKGKLGGGNGFKRAIAEWYLVWMPFDLADILLHQEHYFGWSHADVLRMTHVKPVSLEQEVLFTFATYGLEQAKTRFADCTNEQVKEILDYISTVENFKKINDPVEAAKALALELHNIERVPSHMLRSQEVWNELIPNMDVKTLLDNFQRISTMGFLRNNNVTVMKVVDVLNNLHKAETFKGHPSRVFIELVTYDKAAKYSLDMSVKLNHKSAKVTPQKKPPKSNLLIRTALSTFFYSLFKFQKPTGLRYFVVVDVRPKMFSERCHHSNYLSPIDASVAICLSLVRIELEENVTIGSFHENKGEIHIIPFKKDTEISKYEAIFTEKGESPGPASVASAIHWAQTHNRHVDMFVVLSNYMVETAGARAAINKYRSDMTLPNTKVVTCSFTGAIRSHKHVEGQNMMSVVGFDENICGLINAFARGAF